MLGSIKSKTNLKIVPQPIMFNTDEALTYPKCQGTGKKWNENLNQQHFENS